MRKAIVAAVMAAAIALPGSAALASTPSRDRAQVTQQDTRQSKRDANVRDRRHHHRGGRDNGLDR